MKMVSRLAFALIVALLAAGCATSGPKFSELSSTPAAMPTDTGRIYMYRAAVLGAAVQPEVKLNGEVVGKAVPKGFFYVDKTRQL